MLVHRNSRLFSCKVRARGELIQFGLTNGLWNLIRTGWTQERHHLNLILNSDETWSNKKKRTWEKQRFCPKCTIDLSDKVALESIPQQLCCVAIFCWGVYSQQTEPTLIRQKLKNAKRILSFTSGWSDRILSLPGWPSTKNSKLAVVFELPET